jgi:long-chain acyl-CoA synthetase
MLDYQDPLLMPFSQLLQGGTEFENTHAGFFDQMVETSSEEDEAFLLYTSGTQALPKGVRLNHKVGIRSARECLAAISPQEDFEIFSHMPLTWFLAFPLQVGIHLINAMTVNFPEAPESVLADLREIGPQLVMFTPRQWENLVKQIQLRVEEAGFLKRLCYRVFLPAGYARWERGGQGRPLAKWKDWIGSFLLLNPLKDKLGLRRVRSALTGGASISPESFRFLNALGLNLKQTYGLAEMNPITWQRDGDFHPESVGQSAPSAEIHISPEGEIWVRGDHMFQGYYKDPEATQATLQDGWIRTGDAGVLDPGGRLIYHGRLSDRIPIRDGRSFFPCMIEDRLRFNRFIKDAVVVRRDQGMAFIQIDFETVSKWAEKNNIPYTTFSDLSQKPQVYELIGEAVREANQTLLEEAKVQKYFLLNKPLSTDESELTRSGKLRRNFIIEKYKSLWQEG